MHTTPFILADDSDGWIKFVIFGVVGAIWLIGQAMAAANKLAKKTPNRPPPFGSPTTSAPRQPSVVQPPSLLTIGRPGGPATSLVDARRLAQARAAQARAAQLRQATAQSPVPAVQQRQRPIAQAAPAPSRLFAPPAPTNVAAAHPAAAATAAAVAVVRNAAAVQRPKTSTAAAPRSGKLPTLTPQSLRSQFILTEILRPPLALRGGESR